MSRESMSRAGLLLRVAAAAGIGALLAVAVLMVSRDVTDGRLLAVVMLAAVSFSVLAAGTLWSPSAPPSPDARPAGAEPGRPWAPRSESGRPSRSEPERASRRQPERARRSETDRVPRSEPERAPRAEPDRAPRAEPDRAAPVAPAGTGKPAFAWTGRSARPPATPGADPVTAASNPAPRWRPPPAASSRETRDDSPPVNVAVPVPGSTWWQAARDGNRTRPSAGPASTSPDSTWADPADTGVVTQVTQCPRCGDFAVDVRHQPPGFAFGCAACGHRWRWEPGSAWPAGVVRPSLGRRPADPGS
jgi:hypothetical protein